MINPCSKLLVAGARRPGRALLAVAISCGLGSSAQCAAQEAQVHASFEPSDGALLMGQRGALVVELMAPGYFSGSPAFDLPSMPGVMLIPPTGSPVIGSREVDGVSYTAQRHEVAVFIHRTGPQSVPPFHVRFAFKRAPLDKDVVAVDLTTQAVSLSVTAPPGAEELPGLICANDLTISDQWTPEPGHAKAGDAFTRTITFSAGDVPGMGFPPFPAGSIDGVRIYRHEPTVLDESNRGQLVGKRRDVMTYVCERAGQVTIPAVQLTWWDLDDSQLKTIDLPAHVLNIAANPALIEGASEQPSIGDEHRRSAVALSSPRLAKWILAATLVTLAIAWLAVRCRWPRRIAEYFRPMRLSQLNPEEAR